MLREQGRVGEAIDLYRRGLPHVAQPGRGWHSNVPMPMNFSDAYDDQAVFDARRAFDRDLAVPLARALPPPANPRDPERRLRVGYVSRDLRQHSVRYFLLPILDHHDHDAFEIVCYQDNARATG